MKAELRQLVWSRAIAACEYCRVPQPLDPLPFGIDHIRAQYHGGSTTEENLALACFNGNTFKGTNAAGYDPQTDELTPLFHPRQDVWEEHFGWQGPVLVGKTPSGRATIVVLQINLPERTEFRRLLLKAGDSQR